MSVQIGSIVHYVLDENDVEEITRRRVPNVGHGDNWPAGAQAHVGNLVVVGDHIPLIVTVVFGGKDGYVNGQGLLDGSDSLWVTSRQYSPFHDTGTWHEASEPDE